MTTVTILVGLICATLGVWGTVVTWPLMRQAVLAVCLAALAIGGVLAVLIGVSEVVDRRSRRRNASMGGEPSR